VLNRKYLEEIREHGCRVLVLNSSICDQYGFLCLENERGEVERITGEELLKILRPKHNTLKVDAVFINIEYGSGLVNVF